LFLGAFISGKNSNFFILTYKTIGKYINYFQGHAQNQGFFDGQIITDPENLIFTTKTSENPTIIIFGRSEKKSLKFM